MAALRSLPAASPPSSPPSIPQFPQPTLNPELGSRGTFLDANSGAVASVRDVRFAAVHALRFIGFTLRSAGFPCPALFDPANATAAGLYGQFTAGAAEVCGGLPKKPFHGL